MTRVIITGAKGRMGKTLLACLSTHPDLQLAGQIDQGDELAPLVSKADVVIDFSFHSATAAIAELCASMAKLSSSAPLAIPPRIDRALPR